MRVFNGDRVQIRKEGFYFGAVGTVTSQDDNGTLAFIQLLDGTDRMIQVETCYLEKE